MACMFEVYYRPPPDLSKESALTAMVATFGGQLSFREVPEDGQIGGVCLTYEFADRDKAEVAAEALRERGEHVEGPVDYGP